jgi:hypothetical protein
MNMNKINLWNSIFSLIIIVFFTLTGCSKECEFVAIKTDSLPDGTIGQEYYYELEFETNCAIVHKEIEIKEGKLPKGLELKFSGEFMGTPEETGVFNFNITARVCFGSGGFGYTDCSDKEKNFSLTINQ